jgi:hypothetical protein
MFDQGQILVTLRVIADAADHSKAQLLIETRRLEIMGLKNNLATISSLRFHFDGAHQPGTLALPAHAFRNKEIAHIAGFPPGPTIETSHRRSIGRSQKKTNEISIRYASRSDVEIIQTFLEKPDALGAGFRLHDQRGASRAVRRVCCHGFHYRANSALTLMAALSPSRHFAAMQHFIAFGRSGHGPAGKAGWIGRK